VALHTGRFGSGSSRTGGRVGLRDSLDLVEARKIPASAGTRRRPPAGSHCTDYSIPAHNCLLHS
jgi:hypothetical protein